MYLEINNIENISFLNLRKGAVKNPAIIKKYQVQDGANIFNGSPLAIQSIINTTNNNFFLCLEIEMHEELLLLNQTQCSHNILIKLKTMDYVLLKNVYILKQEIKNKKDSNIKINMILVSMKHTVFEASIYSNSEIKSFALFEQPLKKCSECLDYYFAFCEEKQIKFSWSMEGIIFDLPQVNQFIKILNSNNKKPLNKRVMVHDEKNYKILNIDYFDKLEVSF